MSKLEEEWSLFEPDWYLAMLEKEGLSKEIQEIFYIARVLFSKHNIYSRKEEMISLLSRENLSSVGAGEEDKSAVTPFHEEPVSDQVDIARLKSINQISAILPREFIINEDETIFYKRLLNHELSRRQFEAPEDKTLSVSELVNGKDQEVNRGQKVYLLFDNSSSMNGEGMNKFYAAKAIALEYLRQAQGENPQIFFRSFTNRVGDLIYTEKTNDLKKIIKHIADLHTEDCSHTEIGKAIEHAARDIRSDGRMKKAEILVISDGMGPVPGNLREILGKIKLHIILISGLDIEQILALYPDRAAWDKAADPENGVRKMPSFWESFGPDHVPLSLPAPTEVMKGPMKKNLSPTGRQMIKKMGILLTISQIYQLQEMVDTFIPIPALVGQRFNVFNPAELDSIKQYRKKLEDTPYQSLTIKEKFAMYQRLQFMIKYLDTVVNRKPPTPFRKEILIEIENLTRLLKLFSGDAWFVLNLNTEVEQGKQREKASQRKYSLVRQPGFIKMGWGIIIFLIKKIGYFTCLFICAPYLFFKRSFCSFINSIKKRRLNRLKDQLQTELSGEGWM